MGLIPKHESNRTPLQSVVHYVKEFDLIGIFVIALGLALFLLAFNLYTKQPDQWRSSLIICFLVIGGLLIIGFIFYEKYLAPVTFIPWELLKNRTVIFTYTMAASIYIRGTYGTTIFIPCCSLSTTRTSHEPPTSATSTR